MYRRDVLVAMAGSVAVGAAGCVGSTPGNDGSGWRAFQNDAGHSGYGPAASGPAEGAAVEWRSETWGQVTAPVVADGTVYAGSGLRDHAVDAFDVGTGDRQWRAPVGDAVERELAVADGTVYVGAGDVYALAVDDGDERWVERGRGGRGVAVADGAVFSAERGGSPTFALEADTGEERWSRDVHALPAPTVHDGRVFVGGSGGLVALDAATGETDWEAPDVGRVSRPPTVRDGRVYVTTRERLLALDAATGNELWSLDGRFRASDPAVTGERLFLSGRQREDGGSAARAIAVDVETGDPEWTLDDDGLAAGTAIVADGVVYVSGLNRLYAIDAGTGDRLWWLRFQWPVGPPAVADGTVLASVGGRLSAIVPGDGRDGTWRLTGESTPDRSGAAPSPEYAPGEFSFGTDGYEVTAEPTASVDEGAPVDVSFDVAGDAIDGDRAVTFTLAVTNRSDEALVLPTGAPEPFGVLWLRGDDRSIVAWTDAYEESGHVHTTGHRGIVGVAGVGLRTTIPPAGTVEETYALSTETHGLQPGTYELSETYAVRPAGDGGDERDGDERDGGDDDPGTDEAEWTVEVNASVGIKQAGPEEGAVVHDLAVTDAATLPEAFVGRFSVEALEPVTEAHPGLIEIALANGADERELVASMRGWPFGAYVGLDEDGKRLVLLSEEMYAPGHVERGEDGWWRPAVLPHEESRFGQSLTGFDPDETRSMRYVVLAHPGTDPPRPGDEYLFEQGFAGDEIDVTWGFVLSVLDARG